MVYSVKGSSLQRVLIVTTTFQNFHFYYHPIYENHICMRKLSPLFVILFLGTASFGQSAQEQFIQLKANIQTVEAEKETFEQTLTHTPDNPCKLQITIRTIDRKGRSEEEQYELYWSDIEENTVRYDVSKDKIYVEFRAKNRQPLFRHFEEGQLEGYEQEAAFLAANSENAQVLIDQLKAGIKTCENNQQRDTPPEAFNSLLSWLQQRIGVVELEDETYRQEFEQLADNPLVIEYTRTESDDKGQNKVARYIFNLADLVSQRTGFDVKGDQLFIELETERRLDLIMYEEDGVIDGYENKLQIYLDDIETARNVSVAFQQLIQLSRDTLSSLLPDVGLLSDALQVISDNVTDFRLGEESYKQSLTITPACRAEYVLDHIEDDGDTESFTYNFNLRDFDVKSADYALSRKNGLGVELKANDDLIEWTENGELQKYDDQLELKMQSVEHARQVIHAMRSAIPQCKAQEIAAYDVNWLIDNMPDVNVDDTSYEQQLKLDPENDCSLQFIVRENDGKDTKEYIYEFLLTDMDADEVHFDISGKEVKITLGTRYNEKLIKVFENGEPDDYENEVQLIMPDIETGRAFLATWEVVIESCFEK